MRQSGCQPCGLSGESRLGSVIPEGGLLSERRDRAISTCSISLKAWGTCRSRELRRSICVQRVDASLVAADAGGGVLGNVITVKGSNAFRN